MTTVAVPENRGGSSVLPRYRLTSREKAHVTSALRDLLEFREEVLFAYLHGSFVNGSRFRDIDVAVYLDHARWTRRASLQNPDNLHNRRHHSLIKEEVHRFFQF